MLYSSIGEPYCANCDIPITRQTAEQMAERIGASQQGKKVSVMAPVVRGRKGVYRKEFDTFASRGFLRARVDGEMRSLDEEIKLDRNKMHTIEVVVDRVSVREGAEQRLLNSIRTALKLSQGLALIAVERGEERLYSERLACVECGANIPLFEPRSFTARSAISSRVSTSTPG